MNSSGTGASDKLAGRRFSARSEPPGERRVLGQTKRASRLGVSVSPLKLAESPAQLIAYA